MLNVQEELTQGNSVPSDLHLHLTQRDLTAEKTIVKRQVFGLLLVLVAVLLFAWINLLHLVTLFIGVCMVSYVLMMCFQLVLSAVSADPRRSLVTFTTDELEQLDHDELPVISVLIPLFKEKPEVIRNLIRSISQQRYPSEKQDYLLVIEEDDPALELSENDPDSLWKVLRFELPPSVRYCLIPHSVPKTKPKACTQALKYARGEIVGVWDAEDRPEPLQLMKVAAAYRKLPEDVWCIQARLEFHNPYTCWLTRFFTAEYTIWFQLGLPALGTLNLPVPLGGTSNFFRLRNLVQLGAWDGWNVTEDAHLGVLIARSGKRVLMFDSVTWEEANSELHNWVRQRSRWIKGKMQTYLVHMRRPIQLYRDLGFKGFASFQMMYGLMPLTLLYNPVFWVIFPLDLWHHYPMYERLFPAPVLYLGSISLFLGNAAFFIYAIVGTMIRGTYRNTPWMFLSPVYWALMSVAAWKGFLQLISKKAHKWEKTVHGLVEEVPYTEHEELNPQPVLAFESNSTEQ